MTTKTKPTTTQAADDVLAELAQREEKFADARELVNERGKELASKRAEAQGIEEAYQELYRQHPESFDYHRQPLDPKSDAAVFLKQLDELDLSDCEARYAHAQALEQQSQQSLTDWTASHFDQLRTAIEPQAVEAASEVQRAGIEFRNAADAYLGLAQRIDGWRAAGALRDRELQAMRLRGIDVGGDLIRLAEQFTEEVPSPTETR